MIRNYSDHAANERTFLAWVRTAIAIMAFGFLVEKFGLFVRMASGLNLGSSARGATRVGEVGGLGLMALGLAIVVLAAARFLRTAKRIDDPAPENDEDVRFDLALAAMLFLLGCALTAYLAANLLTGG